jgi:hypothetical protein
VALYQLVGIKYHIVAQVVETELVVRSVGYISPVGFPAFSGVGLVAVDAVDSKTVEIENRFIPFGIPLGQVGVNGYHVNTTAYQGVEIGGEDGNKGFTFTGLHLGDFTLVQNDGAKQLYIVGNHVPFNFIAGHHPLLPTCLLQVSFNTAKASGRMSSSTSSAVSSQS